MTGIGAVEFASVAHSRTATVPLLSERCITDVELKLFIMITLDS
jgi:hypothetical protein